MCDFLKQNNGCDLKKDVADELGIEKREVDDDQIEEFITNYGGQKHRGWDKFQKDYGLEFTEDEINNDDYEALEDDFNKSNLEQYFDKEEYSAEGEVIELHNLRVISSNDYKKKHYNDVYGEFETNIELNEDQIKSIKDYITGQCSDGWGEGFEQRQEVEKIDNLRFDTSIKPWWPDAGYRSHHRKWEITIKKI